MISNVKKLRDKQITNKARIIVYAAPPGCCKTTHAIDVINHNPHHKCLFVSLEMSPIELSKRITNDIVDGQNIVLNWPKLIKRFKDIQTVFSGKEIL